MEGGNGDDETEVMKEGGVEVESKFEGRKEEKRKIRNFMETIRFEDEKDHFKEMTKTERSREKRGKRESILIDFRDKVHVEMS